MSDVGTSPKSQIHLNATLGLILLGKLIIELLPRNTKPISLWTVSFYYRDH